MAPGTRRPPVSVVIPFYGSVDEGREALGSAARIVLGPGDEILVADNTPDGVLAAIADPPPGIRIVDASVRASPYTARNVAVGAAVNDWLLFTDADCVPVPDILDAFFDPAPEEGWGAVAGAVQGVADQPGIVPAYIRSRGHLDPALALQHPFRPLAVTANILVRREAFDALGGFCEGVRSGADSDFCWRLPDAGWAIGYRPAAAVSHRHRATLTALSRQMARDAAGAAWLNRRFGRDAMPIPGVMALARCAVAAPVLLVTGRPRRALYKLIDAVVIVAGRFGYLASNLSAGGQAVGGPPGDVTIRDSVAGDSRGARVEARTRGFGPATAPGAVAYAEDEGALDRVGAVAWHARHTPLRTLRTVAARRRDVLTWAPAARRIAERGDVVAPDSEPGPAGVVRGLTGRGPEA